MEAPYVSTHHSATYRRMGQAREVRNNTISKEWITTHRISVQIISHSFPLFFGFLISRPMVILSTTIPSVSVPKKPVPYSIPPSVVSPETRRMMSMANYVILWRRIDRNIHGRFLRLRHRKGKSMNIVTAISEVGLDVSLLVLMPCLFLNNL